MLQNVAPGVTRVVLRPGEPFERIVFGEGSPFLTHSECSFSTRPVFRLSGESGEGQVRRTANGEVISFEAGERVLLRQTHSARLRFDLPAVQLLTGLGAHEDGIFDYSSRTELLYEHNMKIPIPFLLSSAGWGLLMEAGCAITFRGEGSSFTLELDAVREVSYLVFRGPDCASVLRLLAGQVGKPAMLPKWAFGYIQSKERYRSAEELMSVAGEFRRRGLPLDCIVLDWMSWQEGCWGDKTPDPARFPSVRALTEALHALNVRLMVSVWPNTGRGRDCNEFERAGLFLPSSRIYDAFSPEARDLYWEQCRRFWMSGGTDALWCDSCEPITDPDWCGEEKRDPETRRRLITEASELRMDPETMNDYASRHLRGLREHWLRDILGKRPVLLARAGGPDSGSLGVILWSGDIAARWDVLQKQVTEAVRVACCGIPWWTLDIGAFFVGRKEPWFWRGDYPEGVKDPAYRELYIRFFQFGAMLPIFRSHGTDTPREPWAFIPSGAEDSPEYACLRAVLSLRYRLLPWLYSAAAESCRDGLPMIRAMMTAFPSEPRVLPLHDQYMLGDALLIKPVTRALKDGGVETEVVLPDGGWYDWFTGEYWPGGRTIRLSTPLERFPLLVRAGSILPVASGALCAADCPFPSEEWLVFRGADGRFTLYDDAGDGMDCLSGAFLRIPASFSESAGALTLESAEGSLPADCLIRVRFIRPDGTESIQSVRYHSSGKQVIVYDSDSNAECLD